MLVPGTNGTGSSSPGNGQTENLTMLSPPKRTRGMSIGFKIEAAAKIACGREPPLFILRCLADMLPDAHL